MTDQWAFSYPSPLEGYEHLEPLIEKRNKEGKALQNPQHGILSKAYEQFPDPIAKGSRGGFDIHIYHYQNNPEQAKFAKALWERIRREFPELRIYKFFDHPVGPHTVAMFEVNLFHPAQFGAFVPWLVINRGPLSALIHPNTVDEEDERNHTQRATWLGERIPLDLSFFRARKETEAKVDAEAEVNAKPKITAERKMNLGSKMNVWRRPNDEAKVNVGPKAKVWRKPNVEAKMDAEPKAKPEPFGGFASSAERRAADRPVWLVENMPPNMTGLQMLTGALERKRG